MATIDSSTKLATFSTTVLGVQAYRYAYSQTRSISTLLCRQSETKGSTKQPRGKAEIEHYVSMVESAKDDVDILQYWVDQQTQFPLISKLALDMLVIPASSARPSRASIFYSW